MMKKVLPAALVAGLALAGCGTMNDDTPNNDETPMEDTNQRARDWTPEVNDEVPDGTTGPNMDGVEEGGGNKLQDGGVIDNQDGIEDQTLDGNGNAEDGNMGANSTPDGDNTAGTGNNGGSKKKEDRDGTVD